MCVPLIFFVLLVLIQEHVTAYPNTDYILAYIPIEELAYLPQNIEVLPALYYSNDVDPWYYQSSMVPIVRSPYPQTTGPVIFGGPVKAKETVQIMRYFGNNGFGSFPFYSTFSTPMTVKPQLAVPTKPCMQSATSTLPTITSLPEVILPNTPIKMPFIDTMPSTVFVPATPMSFIVVTTTVPMDISNAGPVKFSGMVPASGRVRIAAHFC